MQEFYASVEYYEDPVILLFATGAKYNCTHLFKTHSITILHSDDETPTWIVTDEATAICLTLKYSELFYKRYNWDDLEAKLKEWKRLVKETEVKVLEWRMLDAPREAMQVLHTINPLTAIALRENPQAFCRDGFDYRSHMNEAYIMHRVGLLT